MSTQILWRVVDRRTNLEIITAATSDYAGDTTGRPTILSLKAAGLHIHLLEEFERNVVHQPEKAARAGSVVAIDQDYIFRYRRTGKRRQISKRGITARGSRRQQSGIRDISRQRHPRVDRVNIVVDAR